MLSTQMLVNQRDQTPSRTARRHKQCRKTAIAMAALAPHDGRPVVWLAKTELRRDHGRQPWLAGRPQLAWVFLEHHLE